MQSPNKNPLQRPRPKQHHQPMRYSSTKSILCSAGNCGLSLNWIPKWETLWQVSPTPELPSCRAPTPIKRTRTSYSKYSGLLKLQVGVLEQDWGWSRQDGISPGAGFEIPLLRSNRFHRQSRMKTTRHPCAIWDKAKQFVLASSPLS